MILVRGQLSKLFPIKNLIKGNMLHIMKGNMLLFRKEIKNERGR